MHQCRIEIEDAAGCFTQSDIDSLRYTIAIYREGMTSALGKLAICNAIANDSNAVTIHSVALLFTR